MYIEKDPRVIVALDFPEPKAALDLVSRLDPTQCCLKVGMELFTRSGSTLVRDLTARGFKVFLDLKFYDIPHTVAQAVLAAADLGVWMVDIHTSGGPVMMQAAADALAKLRSRPLLIGVTVLTSMDEAQLRSLGITLNAEEQVLKLASMANECGLDGFVSSAREAQAIRQKLGLKPVLVTPGIRPQGADLGDQKRVMTPKQALSMGSDYLVIGRPITKAVDPLAALLVINQDLNNLN